MQKEHTSNYMAFTKAVALSAGQQTETSLNFGEGWGEVVEIEAVVHQLSANKTTGQTYDRSSSADDDPTHGCGRQAYDG